MASKAILCWLLVIAAAIKAANTQSCERGSAVCECEADTDVCEFTLTVEEIRTFTRYGVTNPGVEGIIVYINESTGELQPVGNPFFPCSDLSNTDCTDAHFVDGKTYRLAIAVNGLIPGPTLIVYEGQEVTVNVENRLASEGTSIHWHGINQTNTPSMDGAVFITQCPINPGSSFHYRFEATPSGTFWYHSHTGAQRTDGLFGALIVKENPSRKETIQQEFNEFGIGEFEDLPGQHTITLLDWQQEASLDLFSQLTGGVGFYGNPIGQVPTPNDMRFGVTIGYDGAGVSVIPYFSGIINGLGRHIDVPYVQTRLTTFTVEEGMIYRFRLIGVQFDHAYKFSIDGHKLTVIATDGFLVEPVREVDFIIIHTGERYDFLLNATQPGGLENYWIRAETLDIIPPSPGSPPPYQSLGNVAEAILHYGQPDDAAIPSSQYQQIEANSPTRQCQETDTCKAVNCPFEKFHPSYNIECVNVHQLRLLEETQSGIPSNEVRLPAEHRIFFNFNFEGRSFLSSVNGRNFVLPPAPPLTQPEDFIEQANICDIDKACNPATSDCTCVHMRSIPYNETIQFVISAVGSIRAAHPIHLHSHSFQVAHIGYPEYDNTTGTILNNNREIVCEDVNCMETEPNCDPLRCTQPTGWVNGTGPILSIDAKTVRKDTVIIPAGGYVIISFISDNPGYWLLHCHIIIHQLEGMAVLINEAQDRQSEPPAGMNTCGNFNNDNNALHLLSSPILLLVASAVVYIVLG